MGALLAGEHTTVAVDQDVGREPRAELIETPLISAISFLVSSTQAPVSPHHSGGVKLWIDECLSPTLVKRANRRGYWATCNRDRDLLGASDSALHETVIGEEAVFVTNNESDFVALCQEGRSAYRPPDPASDRQARGAMAADRRCARLHRGEGQGRRRAGRRLDAQTDDPIQALSL